MDELFGLATRGGLSLFIEIGPVRRAVSRGQYGWPIQLI